MSIAIQLKKMKMSNTYNFNFDGVDVVVKHHHQYLHCSDHVEWNSIPCSVTETGYYSMWLPVGSSSDDVKNLILKTVDNKPVTIYVKPWVLEQQSLF